MTSASPPSLRRRKAPLLVVALFAAVVITRCHSSPIRPIRECDSVSCVLQNISWAGPVNLSAMESFIPPHGLTFRIAGGSQCTCPGAPNPGSTPLEVLLAREKDDYLTLYGTGLYPIRSNLCCAAHHWFSTGNASALLPRSVTFSIVYPVLDYFVGSVRNGIGSRSMATTTWTDPSQTTAIKDLSVMVFAGVAIDSWFNLSAAYNNGTTTATNTTAVANQSSSAGPVPTAPPGSGILENISTNSLPRVLSFDEGNETQQGTTPPLNSTATSQTAPPEWLNVTFRIASDSRSPVTAHVAVALSVGSCFGRERQRLSGEDDIVAISDGLAGLTARSKSSGSIYPEALGPSKRVDIGPTSCWASGGGGSGSDGVVRRNATASSAPATVDDDGFFNFRLSTQTTSDPPLAVISQAPLLLELKLYLPERPVVTVNRLVPFRASRGKPSEGSATITLDNVQVTSRDSLILLSCDPFPLLDPSEERPRSSFVVDKWRISIPQFASSSRVGLMAEVPIDGGVGRLSSSAAEVFPPPSLPWWPAASWTEQSWVGQPAMSLALAYEAAAGTEGIGTWGRYHAASSTLLVPASGTAGFGLPAPALALGCRDDFRLTTLVDRVVRVNQSTMSATITASFKDVSNVFQGTPTTWYIFCPDGLGGARSAALGMTITSLSGGRLRRMRPLQAPPGEGRRGGGSPSYAEIIDLPTVASGSALIIATIGNTSDGWPAVIEYLPRAPFDYFFLKERIASPEPQAFRLEVRCLASGLCTSVTAGQLIPVPALGVEFFLGSDEDGAGPRPFGGLESCEWLPRCPAPRGSLPPSIVITRSFLNSLSGTDLASDSMLDVVRAATTNSSPNDANLRWLGPQSGDAGGLSVGLLCPCGTAPDPVVTPAMMLAAGNRTKHVVAPSWGHHRPCPAQITCPRANDWLLVTELTWDALATISFGGRNVSRWNGDVAISVNVSSFNNQTVTAMATAPDGRVVLLLPSDSPALLAQTLGTPAVESAPPWWPPHKVASLVSSRSKPGWVFFHGSVTVGYSWEPPPSPPGVPGSPIADIRALAKSRADGWSYGYSIEVVCVDPDSLPELVTLGAVTYSFDWRVAAITCGAIVMLIAGVVLRRRIIQYCAARRDALEAIIPLRTMFHHWTHNAREVAADLENRQVGTQRDTEGDVALVDMPATPRVRPSNGALAGGGGTLAVPLLAATTPPLGPSAGGVSLGRRSMNPLSNGEVLLRSL